MQSAAEHESQGMRLWVVRLAAPLFGLLVYTLLPGAEDGATTLTAAGRATASIACFMALLWVTEAIPLPATALLPLLLFPLANVLPIRQAAAPYAHEFIFLFLGGFMLALAMERWGLHRRIALLCLLIVGSRPDRLVGGFMFATALMSMWISNTASTVMMLPIALGVIDRIEGRAARPAQTAAAETGPAAAPQQLESPFAVALLLGVAYAASIGGVGTLIGTPPNVFLAGFLQTNYDIELGFGRWMLIGLPLVAVFLPLGWWLLTRVLFRVPRQETHSGRALIREEWQQLGPMNAGEKRVFVVFVCTVALWLGREPLQSWDALVRWFPGFTQLTDAGISVAAALTLFFLPVHWRRRQAVLDWETTQRLPWGILLLFGGGLSLAAAFRTSGLAAWISQLSHHLDVLPFVVLLGVIILGIVFLTELTSNTATAATFLPVLGGVAAGLGREPMLFVVPAALAASCAFMMPVATPPNAIVFGSGHLRIGHMLRAGLVFNLVSVTLLLLLTFGLVARVMGA